MKNRLTRLLKVLDRIDPSTPANVDLLATQLGTSAATIRRDLRDLREAGAFNPATAVAIADESSTETSLTAVGDLAPANDDARAPLSAALNHDELVALYVGARFLASEGGPEPVHTALALADRVLRDASPELLRSLDEADARYRFGPRTSERRVRTLVGQAIAERRVLRMEYQGEADEAPVRRDVEPLAQFFVHDRWTFFAFCRTRGEIRQFRHERCQRVELLSEHFTPRGGFSIERFIERQREQRHRNAG